MVASLTAQATAGVGVIAPTISDEDMYSATCQANERAVGQKPGVAVGDAALFGMRGCR
jgi:hypothetical protein